MDAHKTCTENGTFDSIKQENVGHLCYGYEL